MVSTNVEYRCFVGGLAWATNDRSLERAFSSFEEVIESKIISDRETGRSRGFGFITFSNEQAMRDAIKGMNEQNLDERNITINEAQSRGSDGGGGGGGSGRGFRNSGRHSSDGYGGGGGEGYSHSGGGGGGRDHGYGGSDGGSRYRGGGGGVSDGNWRN